MPRAALVSIIIPTYNRRLFLEEAIASCLSQSYPAIEVIVVDDGSRDDTAPWLAARGERLPPERFRFRRQPNRGPSAARNAGLAMARGEYVKFLDSDDSLDDGAIAAYVDAMERHNADLCIGARRYMSPEGRRWRVNYSPPDAVIDRALWRFFRLELRPQGALWLFRRRLFETIRWDEGLLAREDTDLLARLLLKRPVVCGAPGAVYNQRYHGFGRQIQKQFEKSVAAAIIDSNERQLDSMLANRVDRPTRRAFASSLCRMSLRLWDCDRAAAKRVARIAGRAFPFPELVLSKSYPLPLRILAYGLWAIGGVRLCGPLWRFYKHAF